ncbi:hypothetical protein EYF80_011759 [Liparis tanakae]|uniref:Uncharacterized protein n=1 Tax=Liparis tanakae TaxID=230148 RepID=A0A4Z2IJN0_9TELE|nr:hypothetical protein EYF80_011759 [Liparis tanakae]
MGIMRCTRKGRTATEAARKGKRLTGKLSEAHSFSTSCSLQNSSWDRTQEVDVKKVATARGKDKHLTSPLRTICA